AEPFVRRGDLAVIVVERTTFFVGKPSQVSTCIEIGRVTSIKRDGSAIRRVQIPTGDPASFDEWVAERQARGTRVLRLSAELVDVEAALAAFSRRHYPHQTVEDHYSVPPFGSLEEV